MSLENIFKKSLENIPEKNNSIEIVNLDNKLKPYYLINLLSFSNYFQNPIVLFTSEKSKLNLLFNALTYWNKFFSKILKLKAIPIYKYIPFEKGFESEKEIISNSKTPSCCTSWIDTAYQS